MANQKISELTALLGAAVATDDLLPIVDTSTSTTKKITAPELKAYMFGGSVTVSANGRTLIAGTFSDMRSALGLGSMALETAGDYLTSASIALAYQPLDSDLTAIAALATQSYGRSLLTLADASALRTSAGLEIGTHVQAYSSVLQSTTASFTTAQETKLGHITVTQAVDLDNIEIRVNALDAAVVLKGTWDASSGSFPGSGSAQAGDSYIVSVSGTVDGVAFVANDRILAITDNASTSTYSGNWHKLDYTDAVLSVAGRTGAVTLARADITDLGTGVATALGVNVGSSGAFITFGGAAGTPSSITLTNGTGLPLSTGVTGTLGATNGGTGQSTWTTGDILYASASNTLSKLAAGTDGYYLKMVSGVPAWAVVSGGSGGGTKTLHKWTPLDNQPPASNFATLDTRNSVAVLDFDDTTEEAAVFVGVINQGADLTSGIKVRIFWAATSATSGNVRWGAQFEKYGTDIDSDSFDTATEAHTATSGTSGVVVVTEITCTSIDSLAAGDQFRLKIYRDVSDTTNDTVTGDAELVAVEIQQVA